MNLKIPNLKITAILLGVLILLSALVYVTYIRDTTEEDSVENIAEEGTHSGTTNNLVIGEREEQPTSILTWVVVVIISLVVGPGTFFFFYVFVPLGLWWEARLSHVYLSWWSLIKMRWQKVPHAAIIKLMIKATNAHIHVTSSDLVKQYLGGTDLHKLIEVLILGNNAGLQLSIEDIGGLYHAGVDVEKVVRGQMRAHNAGITLQTQDLADAYLANVDIDKVINNLVEAHNAGVEMNFQFLVKQHLSQLDVELIVEALKIAKEGKVIVTKEKLIQHYLEGGHVLDVVRAVVAANNADYELEGEDKLLLSFETAANIDLAGIDVPEAVRDAINYKVVETKDIVGYAGDGVQLTMRARVTIRPRIRKIVKGAGVDTVLARVNEALVSEIGRVATHYDILEDPFLVADIVERKKELFEDTAFEIKSIDIADIRVGKNIHAELEIEKARAEIEKARAKNLAAEEKVQLAMAEAFQKGYFSIEDYKKMKNIESDTRMRDSLTNPVSNGKRGKHDEDEHDEEDDKKKH